MTRKRASINFDHLQIFRTCPCLFSRRVASEVWSPKSSHLNKTIEGVQRRATGQIFPDLSYPMRLERLHLLPLVYRREVKDRSTSIK